MSQYYNGIRRGWITEEHILANEYRRLLPKLISTLVAAIEASGIAFDTVVMAPSSRQDAVPFMAAIVQRWPNARDITSTFGRQGVAKAVDPGGAEVMGKELVHTGGSKALALHCPVPARPHGTFPDSATWRVRSPIATLAPKRFRKVSTVRVALRLHRTHSTCSSGGS